MTLHEIVQSLINDQHLAKSIMVVRASIWPLDGFDMFQLCNGRTEAIWSTKQTYEIGIVGHCMLARE